jgi:outer membrane receptor protein involved in Fe transport
VISKNSIDSANRVETERENKNQTYYDFLGNIGIFYDGGQVNIKPLVLTFVEDKDKFKLSEQPNARSNREDERELKRAQTIGTSVTNSHNFGNGVVLESEVGYYSTTEDKDKTRLVFQQQAVGSANFLPRPGTAEVENKRDAIALLKTALVVPIAGDIRQELKVGTSIRFRDRFRNKTTFNRSITGVLTTRPDGSGKEDYSLRENYLAAFIQNQIWLNESFSILPGVRIENVNLNSNDNTGRNGNSTTTDVLPSLHLLWQATPELNFVAAVSRSVNRPKFDELSPFVDDKTADKNSRFVIGNPDLRPARSWNYDIGGRYETKHLSLSANLFYRTVVDLIEEQEDPTGRTINGRPVFQVQNVGDGYINGLELEQRLSLAMTGIEAFNGLTLYANQTFLGSQKTDRNGVSAPFKEQPNFIGNVGFDYTYDPWGTSISLSLKYVPDRVEVKTDGRTKTVLADTSLNLAVRQRLDKNLSLFFEASNLTGGTKTEEERVTNTGAFFSRKDESSGTRYLLGLNWQF